MTTEFEEWWSNQVGGFDPIDSVHRSLAEKAWHAAQRAVIRTICSPPCVPNAGDSVKFLNMCHPNVLCRVKEIIDIFPSRLDVHWVIAEDDEGNQSSGILGEVEKIIEGV